MKKDPKNSKNIQTTATGQPADEIVLNPKLKPSAKNKLSESTTDTAVVTFGRMNPPTAGHLQLVEKMLDVALEEKAYPLIYLSHSYDPKKNPLSYEEKYDLVREAFGDYVQRSEVNNPIAMLKEVSDRFKNVIVIVGEDRIKDLVRITETYNGKDFNFDSTRVISAGMRDPDSDGVEGVSASKMRELALEGKLDEFRDGLPSQLKNNATVIINMVREGMNLKESIDNIFEDHLDEAGVLSVAGRRKKAIAARKYKSRLKIARKRVQRRIAQNPRLRKRTSRAAIRVMRNRLAGARGKSYSKLSAQEKSSIDRRVRGRSAIIKKLATRLYPATRKKEFSRFKSFRTKKEEINNNFNSYLEEGKGLWHNIHAKRKRIKGGSGEKMRAPGSKGAPSKQDFKDASESILTPKGLKNLEEKANKSQMTLDTLIKVHEQGGWDRVNEFVAKDYTDTNALFELSSATLKSYSKKAKDDAGHHEDEAMSHFQKDRASEKGFDAMDKSEKRKKGADLANKKINQKKVDSAPRLRETKEAPKGFHFTRSGKLKKGDAGQDGDGGKMLRSDPLDKQRSKVPPVSEAEDWEKRAIAGATAKLDNYKKKMPGVWAQMHKDAADLQKKKEERRQQQNNEEYGAGFIGTDKLLKKYENETPGQNTKKFALAVDGVPTKDGIRKIMPFAEHAEMVDEAVYDAENPKKGVQKTRHNLVFSPRRHSQRTYTRMRQKQDAYKKDDSLDTKIKAGEKHRLNPEYAQTTQSGKVEKKKEFKAGGELSKKYGGDENKISKQDVESKKKKIH
jgi:hypothetical protein